MTPSPMEAPAAGFLPGGREGAAVGAFLPAMVTAAAPAHSRWDRAMRWSARAADFDRMLRAAMEARAQLPVDSGERRQADAMLHILQAKRDACHAMAGGDREAVRELLREARWWKHEAAAQREAGSHAA